jgi:flavin reductase (DIM6/NTAB) family NADH-FMN oxidoreductase RutF
MPGTAIHPDLFRALLRRHAAGVVIITAAGARPAGFTATSFTSVSLDPPLVSFCLDRGASSWPAISEASHVGVHVLTTGHADLARRFATSGVDRFAAPLRWHRGRYDVPVLDDAYAHMVCRVAERVHAGDHAIVLAEPVDGMYGAEPATPLVYHDGQYLWAA